MTLFESGDSSGSVSLSGLFRGEFEPSQARADSSEGGVAEKTLTDYLDLLRAMYLLEEVPGWLPPARPSA